MRALTCEALLGQLVGVAMAQADTGLPPDLSARLKLSAASRWADFADAHADSAGVSQSEREQIILDLSKLSNTDQDREHTVATVRDCLDNAP